jgi:hypothetical protein
MNYGCLIEQKALIASLRSFWKISGADLEKQFEYTDPRLSFKHMQIIASRVF